MAIKMVPDLGAPLTVVAIDLAVESLAPNYSKWATGALAAGGYLAAWQGWGGDFVKNVGIAALPAFAKNVYDYVRGGASSRATHMSLRRVARYPAPAQESPFGGARLV